MILLSISLVLTNEDPGLFGPAVDSVLHSEGIDWTMYVIDNSADGKFAKYLQNLDETRIVHIANRRNLGFGAAHNVGIQLGVAHSRYHLILNPDIRFGKDAINKMFRYMDANLDVAVSMPKVIYPDGEFQRLVRKIPTPMHLIGRRFLPDCAWRNSCSDGSQRFWKEQHTRRYLFCTR